MRTIPFSPPDISEAEIAEVCETLRSGWITTGPRTKLLEKKLADYCGTDMVVCLNSATAALELNLRILGIGEGDEVIVPAYTYTASASPVIHVGAKVVFIDSASDTFEFDYDKVFDAITEKTKAIIPVDLGGVICNYDKLYEIVKEKSYMFSPSNEIQKAMGRVAIVADCAHSLGAYKDGKMAGQFADFSSFSFHAVKNFTTAEGGAATWRTIDGIDNKKLYKQYQLYSLHGQSVDTLSKTKKGSWEYDIVGPWYKCNMTDIMAAIGLRQLERFPALLARRKAIIRRFDDELDKLGVFHLDHSHSSGHLYITRIDGINGDQRNEIINKMSERGVICNVHYKPLPMMTGYMNLGFDIKDYPNSYNYFINEITLPLYTKLSDDDVEYIITNYVEIIKDYLQ